MEKPPPKVAKSGVCGTLVIIAAVVSIVGGNLFSYVPLDSIADALKNTTQMAKWAADPANAPFAYRAAADSFILNFLGLFILPCLAAAVYKSRDKEAATWYEQYCNTFGQRAMMFVLYACLWGFVGHIIQLLLSYNCDICTGLIGKEWPSGSTIAKYYPSAFWLHAVPAGVISLFCPFQLTERVRKWNDYKAHRWIGRVVLIASCVHQTSATYLTISNLFFNHHKLFPTSWTANTVYALGFVPFNIYTWTSTIQGWRCARRGWIVEHGAWMYRLSSMWVITVVLFRWLNGFLTLFFGAEWGTALHVWFAFLWVIPLEIFLQRSGRFDWSNADRAADAREPDSIQCPFSRVASNGSNGVCLFAAKSHV